MGNNLTVTRGYDQYEFPSTLQTGTVQNMQFSFNTATGNLTWRKDNLSGRNFTENFTYDNLDRLTNCQIGASNYGTTYQNNGNIVTKHDAGTCAYGDPRPHAVTGLTGSPMTAPDQTITYSSFRQPVTLTQQAKNLAITYGVDEQRIKSVYAENSVNWTRKYLGNYEEVWVSGQVNKKIHYIAGSDGLAAVYIINGTSTGEMYYVSTDYLSNILLLTRQNGTVAEEYSFDTWGRMRNPATWVNYAPGSEPDLLIAGRGFTEHEHLKWFNIINMNGRCYDPLTGQFLSPDNYIQSPDFSQNFNRYSYCLNNPLKYTDPSGENWFGWLVGGIIGGVANVIANWDDIDGSFVKFNQYAFVGCVAGSTASWLADNGVGGPGIGMASGWLLNSGNAYIRGARGGDVIQAGGEGALLGGVSGFAMMGLNAAFNELMNIHWTSYENYSDLPAHNYHEITLGDYLFGSNGSNISNTIANQGTSNASVILAAYYSGLSGGGAKFYEADVRFIPESVPYNSFFAGAINTQRSVYNNYLTLGLNSNAGKLLTHEYGHFLQSEYGGKLWYNLAVVPTSLLNINKLSPFNYNRTWTEVQANTMSYYYFHYPSFWDFNEYPINHRYIGERLKSRLYYHKR